MPSVQAPTAQSPSIARDFESIDLALEVAVIWGDQNVLHVEHLSPPRAFWVGEEARLEGERTDFLIGRESLGVERLPIAIPTESGIQVVVPHGASCVVEDVSGQVSLAELALEDRLAPCPALAHAVQFALPIGATARVEHNGFAFVLKWTQAALPIAREAALEPVLKSNPWTFASVGVHLAVLGLFYMMPPHSAAMSFDVDSEQVRRLQIELMPPEQEEVPEFYEPNGQQQSADGAPAPDAAARRSPQHKAKAGGTQCSDCDRHAPPAPGNLEELARNGGIISVLRTMGTLRAFDSQFDAAHAQGGADVLAGYFDSYRGPFGSELGMNGTGYTGGVGGPVGTIGIGILGTRGDVGPGGDGTGIGSSGGTRLREREPRQPPPLRAGTPEVKGSLSKEVIARTIHRHLAEVRFCYEQQLNAHPDLLGRLAVKFVIAPDGSVKMAARDHSDVGNAAVERCVVEAVQRWIFPQPIGGGIVIVTYPFMFAQTGNN